MNYGWILLAGVAVISSAFGMEPDRASPKKPVAAAAADDALEMQLLKAPFSPPSQKPHAHEKSPHAEEDEGESSAEANAADPEAHDCLALRYHQGQGVAQDDGQAMAWFQKAAAQGHEGAIQALARLRQ